MQKKYFFTKITQNKKSSDLEIITNRFEITFLQILIPTKNEFLMSF
jgi:hypothetical protein